ncbi:hypothetical protein, partial [Fodinibius halophilus]|uniref:hypothetical protein n=1 Tax=Fodinibius halophilus TaxID=1736908 RepID=UPI00197A90DC
RRSRKFRCARLFPPKSLGREILSQSESNVIRRMTDLSIEVRVGFKGELRIISFQAIFYFVSYLQTDIFN